MKKASRFLFILVLFTLLISACAQQTSQGSLRRLTLTEGDQYFADWSPDGKTIVYEGQLPKESTSIWTIRIDGSNIKQLFKQDKVNVGTPVFDPKGSKIAYSAMRGQYTLWIMQVDGSNQTQLNTPPDKNRDFPQFNPDGTKISYSEYSFPQKDNHAELRIMDSDGTNSKKLADLSSIGRNMSSWSPDGKTIAFDDNGHIWKIGADGSNLAQLTNSADAYDSYPDFSPDGSKISFQSQKTSGSSTSSFIEVINSDGTNRTSIIDNRSQQGWDTVGEPRWSPDGKSIVFTVQKGTHYELWLTVYR